MGLQVLHRFFILDPTESALADYKKGLITDIRTEFVKKLNLTEVPLEGKTEERPGWETVFLAIQKDPDDHSGKPPSWIELKKNKNDRFFELNAHVRDGRIEEYPRYSKILYTESSSCHLEEVGFAADICPVTIQLSYDMGEEKHRIFFDVVEDLVRYAYKIQFYMQEGKKENECIDKFSLAYLASEKPAPKLPAPAGERVRSLEADLNELNSLFETISYSVNRLFSIKNHLALDLQNIRNIQSRLHEEFHESVEIGYIENKVHEIDYKTRDSQIFLELLRDRKDITLGKVKIEENKQLINYNRDLLKIHQDAAVVESAAVVITFITLFQVLIQCVSSVIPNYVETSIVFKVGIPFFISLGVISIVECIKVISALREEDETPKSLIEIVGGDNRAKIIALGIILPFICLVIIFYIWNVFIG